MAHTPTSPKPKRFSDRRERDYWHAAQDIVYRAGAAIVEREGKTWLIFADREEPICTPIDHNCIWFETWCYLKQRYPELCRMWVGGRAITKPGEMEHRARAKSRADDSDY